MKKIVSLLILSILLLISPASADEYYGHPDIYFPYDEINIGDVFWTDNCFTYYPKANGFSNGVDCYDDQAVTVVSKAEPSADHPVFVSGKAFEGWVDMDFFYCKKTESDWNIYEEYRISFDELDVGDQLMFHGDKVYRYANGSKKYVKVRTEGVYVKVVDKYHKTADHPIQIQSLIYSEDQDAYMYDGAYYGWVDIEDLYAYGGNW